MRGGSGNTFIGQTSGYNTSGSNNTFIGAYRGIGNESGVIALSDGGQNLRAIYNSGWVFTGSVDIQNTLTASLAQGFTYVGDANGRTTLVTTSSFVINTGSFATTGSNNFVGDQTITGSLYVSSSTQKDVIIEGQLWVSSSNMFASGSTVQPQINISGPVSGIAGGSRSGSIQLVPDKITILRGARTVNISSTVINVSDNGVGAAGQSSAIYPGGLDNGTLDGNEIGLTINGDYLGVTNFAGPSIWIADNTLAYKAMFGFQDTTNYTDGRITAFTPLVISSSLTIQSGSSFFANGNKQFNVGAFQSNITQSGSANVSQSMNFETTDISSGVSIASNSRITLANSGTYNIQFSAQVLADSGADDVYIWLKKNGTNVSASAGKVTLANNEELIAAWNYVVDAAASDYFEIVWQSTNGDAVLLTETASGNIPSIPSVILTVTQVR